MTEGADIVPIPAERGTGVRKKRRPQRRRGRVELRVLKATNEMRRQDMLGPLDEASVELALSLALSVDRATEASDHRAVAQSSGELRQVLKVLAGSGGRPAADVLGDLAAPE